MSPLVPHPPLVNQLHPRVSRQDARAAAWVCRWELDESVLQADDLALDDLLVRRPSGQQQRHRHPDAPVDTGHRYRDIGDWDLMDRGATVYLRPDGPFTYGEFTSRSIQYELRIPMRIDHRARQAHGRR